MARVVVVHGIGQEFSGPESMQLAVGAALRDGVRLAGSDRDLVGEVECAFYGHVFHEPGTRAVDVPPWDETDVAAGIEAELLAAWWATASAIEPERVQAPDSLGTRGVLGFGASRALRSARVRAALDALAASSFFARIADRTLILGLKQVRRYLTEPATRQAAREAVALAVTPDTRVLVAHSLGSVVAYEALCANSFWPVTDFVTLGSPLGMPSVIFDRLSPAPFAGIGAWPGEVARWVNIADHGDVVALPAKLAERFGPGVVRDERITNGARMHDLRRYLTSPTTGAAIAVGLTQGRVMP